MRKSPIWKRLNQAKNYIPFVCRYWILKRKGRVVNYKYFEKQQKNKKKLLANMYT